jgi:hypothetical protein
MSKTVCSRKVDRRRRAGVACVLASFVNRCMKDIATSRLVQFNLRASLLPFLDLFLDPALPPRVRCGNI